MLVDGHSRQWASSFTFCHNTTNHLEIPPDNLSKSFNSLKSLKSRVVTSLIPRPSGGGLRTRLTTCVTCIMFCC